MVGVLGSLASIHYLKVPVLQESPFFNFNQKEGSCELIDMTDQKLWKALGSLPPLYATEKLSQEKIFVRLKLFNLVGNQSWYLTEYSPTEKVGFGLADLGPGFTPELGYVSVNELLSVQSIYFLLDIDAEWNASTTLAEVMKELGV